MPEGLASIDDLKVVITASTEEMSKGLENAAALITRFSTGGTEQLGKFDAALAKVGGGIMVLRGALGAWAQAATVALTVLETVGEKAETAARFAGAGAEVDDFKDALKNAVSAFTDVATRTDSSTRSASFLRKEIVELGSSFTTTEQQADSLTNHIRAMTELIDRGAHEVRRMTTMQSTWSVNTVDVEIDRTRKQIEQLAAQVDKVTQNGSRSMIDMVIGAVSPWHRQNIMTLDELQAKIAALQGQMEQLNALRTTQQWKVLEVDDTSGSLLKNLDAEIASLRIRAATLGMNAAEAAAYAAAERIRQDAERQGIPLGEAFTAHMQERLGLMRQLRLQIDGHAEAERKARQDKAEAERNERARKSVMQGSERDLQSAQARLRLLGDQSQQTRQLTIEERLLAQARQRGVELGEDDLVVLKARAAEIAKIETEIERQKRVMDSLKAVGDSVGRSLEQAFDRFFTTGKAGTKEMVDAMLRDLARLAFREAITKTLIGGVTGGLGGVLGDMLPARAEGGPVVPGQAYLVGERGPEVVEFPDYGNVIPNHALGNASGGNQQPQSVDMKLTINLEGANGDETIARIARQAAAEGAKQAVATSDANFANRNRRLTLLGA